LLAEFTAFLTTAVTALHEVFFAYTSYFRRVALAYSAKKYTAWY